MDSHLFWFARSGPGSRGAKWPAGGQNDPHKDKKRWNFIFWGAGCFLSRIWGFSCSLNVLLGGQVKNLSKNTILLHSCTILQFFLSFKPWFRIRIDLKCWIGSGSTLEAMWIRGITILPTSNQRFWSRPDTNESLHAQVEKFAIFFFCKN